MKAVLVRRRIWDLCRRVQHKFRRRPTILTWDNRGLLSLNVLTFDLDAGAEQMEGGGMEAVVHW